MNNMTFISCNAAYEDAKTVIFGAPFDGTTSFRPGTRFAAQTMRLESDGIETYSPYQDKDLIDQAICDIGDLEFPFGNVEAVLDAIEQETAQIITDGKLPLMIGGEHLVSLGTARAMVKKYPDLHILHFDAHADLRDDYLGQKLSHATVMHRIWDLVGDDRIYQFGIRSGDRDEFTWGKDHVITRMFDCEGLDKVVHKLKGKPVYVSIDLDVLDPSIFPGTGTPEAGGISFYELLNAILTFKGLNVVGADVNELSPHYDVSGVSTAVACKVLRELLLVLA